MTRRLIPLALAVALGLAFSPATAPAARMTATAEAVNGAARFHLTNGLDGAVAERALALVTPPGTIVPTDPAVSPLTILEGSSGFDQDNLRVLLIDGISPRTGEEHAGIALGLVFENGGFAPGGVLNFEVSLLPEFQGPLTLELIPPTSPDVSILAGLASDPGGSDGEPTPSPLPNVPGGPGGGPTPVQIPEPLSVLVWSSLAGLGLIRAHAFRRAHAPRA